MKKLNQFVFLFLALLLMVLSFIINNIEVKNDNSKEISRFQKEIYQKENQLNFYLQQALPLTNEKFSTEILIEKFNPDLYKKHGIAILVYQNDSLIFWSHNCIPFSLHILDTTKTTSLLNLENGYYLCKFYKTKNNFIIALALIKNNYPYHNQYLTNNFFKNFRLSQTTELSTQKGNFNIFSSQGDFLCSLKFPSLIWHESIGNYLSIFLFFLGIFLFIFFLHHFLLSLLIKKINHFAAVIIYILIIILLRIFTYIIGFPDFIQSHDFFKPSLYAHSNLLSSLGDLTINVLLGLYFAFILYLFSIKHYYWDKIKILFSLRIIFSFLLLLFCAVIMHYTILLIGSLIINSSISFQISNIFILNIYSYIGFTIIFCILLACYLLLNFALKIFYQLLKPKNKIIILLWTFFQIIVIVYYYFYDYDYLFLILGLQVIAGVILIYEIYLSTGFSYKKMLGFIILFALFSTFALNKYNKRKENEFRKLLALKISTEQDVIAEYLFDDVYQKIVTDSFFIKQFYSSQHNEEEILKRTLAYFTGYWDKYNKQIWICHPEQKLIIQPNNIEITCDTLFWDMIKENGKPTLSANLFYLRNNTINNNYVAVIDLIQYVAPHRIINPYKIYIELYSKYIPRELGYPELLIDQKVKQNFFTGTYSYAKYKNHELVMNYGQFFYSITDYEYYPINNDYEFFNKDNYNHLFYKIDNNYSLIISKKIESYFNTIAPFSYLFIFYFVLIHLFLLLQWLSGNLKITIFNLTTKIQLSLVVIIVLSFLFIGSMSVYFIVNLYENKNISAITEKAHSVMIELEQKFAGRQELNEKIKDYLNNLLLKFQNIFFTDIHVFDVQGNLLGTSKPQIFEDGLISSKMNIMAYKAMKVEQKSYFIQKENIGKLAYSSVYIPLRNNNNKIIAFINLPYFGKQSELKNEISEFIVSFINIYVLLIAIAVLIALLISNQITLPLQLLRQSFGNINLNKTNQKIQWDKKDEIGMLIAEYNRMIDELAMSAELLAKSERESAWREMAKQVAHEIKNPLTPMKLSVQHLYKAWNDNPENWNERLEKFTQTMIAQIDTLSRIATEFSNFAKMPAAQFEQIELVKFIKDISNLYIQNEHIKVQLISTIDYCYIKSDNKQLISVFNNLFKNSIQAADADKELIITIEILENNGFCIIKFSDNGCGIPENLQHKIFSPNFTTKSSGMGLGLAMVKSIIEQTGGTITFKSMVNQGTTFEIHFPVYKNEN